MTTPAHASYWNVFNIEGETNISADIVTYSTMFDMLTDTNRTGVYTPDPTGFGGNIIGSGSDGTSYWNVYNFEGETSESAQIATYSTLLDMLLDTNRTDVYTPDSLGFGNNIIGSGSDGTSYWNVFNIEGETNISADIVTYSTMFDMLLDTNRTGVYTPDPTGFGGNIIGSGSDGTSYWNVYNFEGETSESAQIATYSTLLDMLTDTNRTDVYTPDSLGFGNNIIGSGSDGFYITNVIEPAPLAIFVLGLMGLSIQRFRKQ